MFNFIQSPISHNLRDPHSKALPACRRAGNLTASPLRLRLRHSLTGRGLRGTCRSSASHICHDPMGRTLSCLKVKFLDRLLSFLYIQRILKRVLITHPVAVIVKFPFQRVCFR